MDIAREMLEESVELVEVLVGRRQKLSGLGLVSTRADDGRCLEHELVAKPFDLSDHAHRLAPLESRRH